MPKDKFVWQHYLKKAMQMEKEQIEEAFWEQPFPDDTAFEEYYQETYQNEWVQI